jgi:hypothetical protein
MAVNIFGSGSNNVYDIGQDMDLNNNTIHNVKDPENEQDVANKKYVDTKIDGWSLVGNALLTEGKIGTSNDYSFTLVRNNMPQMKFLADGIVARVSQKKIFKNVESHPPKSFLWVSYEHTQKSFPI